MNVRESSNSSNPTNAVSTDPGRLWGELLRRGVDLHAVDGRLRWSAAPGAVPVALAREVAQCRAELYRFIDGGGTPDRDPRPELVDDHGTWRALLAEALAVDGTEPQGLFGLLHFARCGGAALVFDDRYGLRLEPGEWPADEWAAFRTSELIPRGAQIRASVAAVSAAASRETPS
jgi:hypothetical protein